MDPVSITTLTTFAIPLALFGPISFLLGWGSGWWKIARIYPSDRRFDGTRIRFQSARLGSWIAYNNALTFRADPLGFAVRPWPIFRVGHPEIFIPWGDLDARIERRLWIPTARLVARRCPDVPITVTLRLARRLEHESRGAFSLPAGPEA